MKKPTHPRDPNQLTRLIRDMSTGEVPNDSPAPGPVDAKTAARRKGGVKGGKARQRRYQPSAGRRSLRRVPGLGGANYLRISASEKRLKSIAANNSSYFWTCRPSIPWPTAMAENRPRLRGIAVLLLEDHRDTLDMWAEILQFCEPMF